MERTSLGAVGELAITVAELRERSVLSVVGEFDLAEVGRFEERLLQLERKRPKLLVVDLSDVTFIDSTGLRVLIEADKRAKAEKRRFALVRGPDPIHEIFRVTLLDRRFEWSEPAAPA